MVAFTEPLPSTMALPPLLPPLQHSLPPVPLPPVASLSLHRLRPSSSSDSHTQPTRRIPTFSIHNNQRESAVASPPPVDKRARRKEQCRVNQANYRKRKRQHEQQLACDITALQQEIHTLTARRLQAAAANHDLSPEHAIAAFYVAMQTPASSPAAPDASTASLLELQSEHFASLAAFQHVWKDHQRRFAKFQLRVKTTERLETRDCALVKVVSALDVHVATGDVVCGVQHRFEIDLATDTVVGVTSDVDVVQGLSTATQHTLHHVARLLYQPQQWLRSL